MQPDPYIRKLIAEVGDYEDEHGSLEDMPLDPRLEEKYIEPIRKFFREREISNG